MGKVQIQSDLCKGCGYCILYCPKHVLDWSGENNHFGYSYPVQKEDHCVACGVCYRVCPDCAITVYR